jgi:acetyltransferase-like isoleucine patch superfamily enzyme
MKTVISPNIRVRHRELFEIGDGSIVDDFCYFSTQVKVGVCSHIASGCSVAGGKDRCFEMGDYSSLSSGVRIWCSSDDFVNDIVTILPEGLGEIKTNLITGDVKLGNYTAVGSNSIIMPRNHVPIGTVIGALSFAPADFNFQPWSVYAGTPIRFIRPRNRENVLRQVRALDDFLKRESNAQTSQD